MKTLFGKILCRFSKEMLRGDLITVLSLLKRGRGEDDTDLSVTSISTRGNGMKLHQGKFRLVTGSSSEEVGTGTGCPEKRSWQAHGRMPGLVEASGQPLSHGLLLGTRTQ